jgi:hypothetical protein
MEILLALAAAVSYGVSDFAGGVLTRRADVFVVALVAAYLLREGRDWRAADGGHRLLLVESGAGGERPVEPVSAQRLGLGVQRVCGGQQLLNPGAGLAQVVLQEPEGPQDPEQVWQRGGVVGQVPAHRAAPLVDHGAAGGGDQPPPRVAGDALLGPVLQGGDRGVLDRVLADREVS